jgi:hypothetical protein
MVQNLVTVSDELQVNLLDPIPRLSPPTENGLLGNQIFPEITALDNGNFVVVYQNDAGGAGDQDIMSIEFNANGQPVGAPFRVDFDLGDQGAPDVTHRVGGGFATVWSDDGATQSDIHMVVVTTGTPTNPAEFTVADFADDLEGPVIGTFANGTYIVAYQREGPGSDDVWFAIVNASGTGFVAPNTGLVTTVSLNEGQQRLATSGNTAAIVYTQGDTSSDIKLNLINSAGSGLDFQTVANAAAPTALPDIATLADGRFIVVWSQAAASFDLMGRIYDPVTESFSGGAFPISAGGNDELIGRVVGLPDGGFLVTWVDAGPAPGNDPSVHARRFDAGGAPAGDAFTLSENAFTFPAAAINDDGRLFLAWMSLPGARSTDPDIGIQGRIFQPATETVNGTPGDDTIRTYSLSETINGLAGNDTIDARAGNDVMSGGLGRDRLTGGPGGDGFRFDVKLKGANADRITDFVPGVDNLVLDRDVFKKLKVGDLKKGAFFAGNKVDEGKDGKDLVVYDKKSGKLYYDADGPGGAHAKLVATLDGSPNGLKAGDIIVVA